ncbi:MAG: thioredoxin domain-containing protein [Syntrophomonadaceae bacterium]
MEINLDRHTRRPNRLAGQKSPYLLQHAYNPVDWYPWGDEAFDKARAEDKPIFLSIGYSTCHWCHVMERQSFENEQVAALLNQDFISVKVDREERPDIDHIYMQVCQTLTGSGGWPLTVVMTPAGRPFYAATYIPPYSQGGTMGMADLLPRLAGLWKKDKDKVRQAGDEISQWVQKATRADTSGQLTEEALHQAFGNLARSYDSEYGGFGSAPKFPTPTNLMFLLQYHRHFKNEPALEMAEKTLIGMYQGGIYDHVGFGFARYSTDRRWLVPHFEKMLYDNALLAMAYLEAYQATSQKFYQQVAEDIFTYVLRDMRSPQGGFYSAEDADSEGEEGRYYVWDREEVVSILGPHATRFGEAYDITAGGNFEGRNIPNLIGQPNCREARDRFDQELRQLLQVRERRVKPFKDDKILTAWNGLMIAALGLGGRLLRDDRYLEAARQAADFILVSLRREDGRLLAGYRDGEALCKAYAADYAYLIWGLLELHEAAHQPRYLQAALELNRQLLDLFWDQERGGLFFYGSDSEPLLTRPKESYDSVMPSDNAVAAYNFLRLGRLAAVPELAEKGQAQIKAFAGSISESPGAHSFWLQAFMYQEQLIDAVNPR